MIFYAGWLDYLASNLTSTNIGQGHQQGSGIGISECYCSVCAYKLGH